MRTKNFFKSLAVAAVALVGVCATSCSEEELNVDTNGNWSPVELPAASASIALSVVDLGDAGVEAKVLYTGTLDATAKIGQSMTIECPADKYDATIYTVADAQTINIPAIQKGQAVVIPVTFYVTKFTSLFNEVAKPILLSGEGMTSIEKKYNEDAKWKNESNYVINWEAKIPVETGLFEIAASGRAATTEADILDAFWDNYVEASKLTKNVLNVKGSVRAWGYPVITIKTHRLKETYKVTYKDTTSKEYTVEHRINAEMSGYEVFAIPGHEHAYEHYHGHGHGHGSDSNAGGGVTVWE